MINQIKLLVLDIDGVLTDGSFSVNEKGQQEKSFNLRDFDFLTIMKKEGFKIAAITGESNSITDYIKARFLWDSFRAGCKEKREALLDTCSKLNIAVENTCYIGDGVYDLPALQIAGLSACPSDAISSVRENCKIVLRTKGGRGCIEELYHFIAAPAAGAPNKRFHVKKQQSLDKLIERYSNLAPIRNELEQSLDMMVECYMNHHKIMTAGNGGSAADSEHIVGELLKSFKLSRPLDNALKERFVNIDSDFGLLLSEKLEAPLRAVSLTGHPAFSTAFLNDVDGDFIVSQALLALGNPGDVFIAISTSGNSRNLVGAAVTAKAIGIKVIALTGKGGGKLKLFSDCAVIVPEKETYLIQECHVPIYHWWCAMIEEFFFDFECRN